MKYSDFCKKNDELQKQIINAIMDFEGNFKKNNCDEYGEHPSGISHLLMENISDVPENAKWNIVANAANMFASTGSDDLAGLFPGWEKEWLELSRIWYDAQENGWTDE